MVLPGAICKHPAIYFSGIGETLPSLIPVRSGFADHLEEVHRSSSRFNAP